MIRFRRFFYFFSIIAFSMFSCTRLKPKICIKEGKKYCVTSDWIYVIDWDSCYRRGLNCMDGECWEEAIAEFSQAIKLRFTERRDARPYGMHFRDYFPHREMGICYLYLGKKQKDLDKIKKAIVKLELSLSQAESARAKYYLNEAHRSYLFITGLDTTPPFINIEKTEHAHLTSKTPFILKGSIQDNYYVESVTINREPVLIELAAPFIPFTTAVNLKEGWNTINVVAKDLVNDPAERSIDIYLDRQGPAVIINPIQFNYSEEPEQVLITAVVYDESGIVSFKLDDKEVSKFGVDELFLIEESISILGVKQYIPFWTKDRAGNVTHGQINIYSHRRRRHNLAMRLASTDPRLLPLPRNSQENGILINITSPSQEDSITYEKEVPLEGTIIAKNGIKTIRIKINDRLISSEDEVRVFFERSKKKLNQRSIEQNIPLETFYTKFDNALKRENRYQFNFSETIDISKEHTKLIIFVDDILGNEEEKSYSIKRVHKEEILKSYQRMQLAILPFNAMNTDMCDYSCLNYLYESALISFKAKERFNIMKEGELKKVLPGDLIEMAGKTQLFCDENLAQMVGKGTSAEGVICGCIQKWKGGIEIDARFRDKEEGDCWIFHDVHIDSNTTDDPKMATTEKLGAAISNLTKKFHNDFPDSNYTGRIIDKKGNIIYADIGSDMKIFPGIFFNIFKKEEELITRAHIKNVAENESRAEISDVKKSEEIKKGFYIRVR